MDGLSNPIVFGWESFLGFEFLTILVEGFVMWAIIDLDKPMSSRRAFFMLIVMNIASMIFAVPFWMVMGER